MNDYWGPKMLSGVGFTFKNQLVVPHKPNLPELSVIDENIKINQLRVPYDFTLEDSVISKCNSHQSPQEIPNDEPIKITQEKPPITNNFNHFQKIDSVLKPQKVCLNDKFMYELAPYLEIKDFESIEDPFEMAELKTIDDKKELQLLMQDHNLFRMNGGSGNTSISAYNLENINFPSIPSASAMDNFSKSSECSVSRSFRM